MSTVVFAKELRIIVSISQYGLNLSLNIYKCPICSDVLYQNDNQWQCAAKHSFDIAKQGYVNLLPVNKKRSKEPGDSKPMLQSRRIFLNSGYYAPLAEGLQGALFESSSDCPPEPAQILDLGCGEGYYLDFLSQRLTASADIRFAALDISKFAVQMTAKRVPNAVSCVASAVDTPYLDNSFDVIYDVFAPYSVEEIKRILKPEGRFILVGPGANHLKELSAMIYQDVVPHAGNVAELTEPEGLQLLSQQEISSQQQVPQHHIENLLAMTPYFWSTSKDQKAVLYGLENLTVTLHFEILEYSLSE